MRIKLISGDEQDALTKARRFYSYKAGVITKIKRRYIKRLRQFLKQELKKEQNETIE